MNTSITHIGLIGVGTMGRIVLRKLLDAGYTVRAYDPSPVAQDSIKENGAELSPNIAKTVENVELCILSLPSTSTVIETVGGDNGIAVNGKKGMYILDTSTIDPDTSKKAAQYAQKEGQRYLDAPLLGRPAAPEGWVSPVGGEKRDYEAVKEVIESYTARSIHVGPLGAGNTLKLLNQLMFSTLNCITSEVMAICSKTDLSPETLYDTVAHSGASTVSGLFKEVGYKICQRDYDPAFTINLLAKDSELAEEMAKKYKAPSLLLSNANFLITLAQAKGYGAEDTSALFKAYNDLYETGVL